MAGLTKITKNSIQGIDTSADATAITIDSSENVFVGKTSSGVANVGAELRNGSSNYALLGTASSEAPMILNRTTSDGDIIKFRKDNSAVGSIGVSSSGISIKLGGTGSANALDDYEEGTWTPTVLNGWGILNPTYSTNTGYYTKIGNLVYVLFKIILSGGSTNGNPLVIHGLPYNSNATPGGSGIYDTLHGSFSTASSNATNVFMKVGSNNTSNAQAFYKTSSGEANFTGTNAGGSFNCTFSGIYRTDS